MVATVQVVPVLWRFCRLPKAPASCWEVHIIDFEFMNPFQELKPEVPVQTLLQHAKEGIAYMFCGPNQLATGIDLECDAIAKLMSNLG